MPQRKMPETLGFWIFNLLAMREFHAFRPIFYRTAQAAMCFGQRVNLQPSNDTARCPGPDINRHSSCAAASF